MKVYNTEVTQKLEAKLPKERESHFVYEKTTFIKKTYQLFAASLIAATTGAYIGMQMTPAIVSWYWGLVILEFIALFALFFLKDKPGINLAVLFAFTFLTGITLTPLQQAAVLEIGHTALPHSGQKLSPEFSSEPHSPQDLALSCVLEAHSSL